MKRIKNVALFSLQMFLGVLAVTSANSAELSCKDFYLPSGFSPYKGQRLLIKTATHACCSGRVIPF